MLGSSLRPPEVKITKGNQRGIEAERERAREIERERENSHAGQTKRDVQPFS